MRLAFPLLLLGLLQAPSTGLFGADKDPAQDPLRKEAVEWIKTQTQYDAENPLFQAVLSQIDTATKENKYFTLGLGADLMKSGKAQLVYGFAGKFFQFELSPARAKKLKLATGDATSAIAGGNRPDQREPTPLVKLEDLQIKNANKLSRKKRIGGEVYLRKLEKMTGKYVLRLSYQVDDAWTYQFYPLKKLNKERGKLSFDFEPLGVGKKKKAYAGPVAVFLDLCSYTQKNGVTKIKIYSNTVGTIVDVTGKKRAK